MKRSLLDEERTISRTSDALHSYNFTMSPYWNILLLALAWALTLTTSTLLTTIGPLSAKNLGASDSIAAFTIGSFLIGAALSSVPSSWIFRIYGRLIGFSLGCVAQITGSCMGAISIASESLFLLYAGCFFVGLGQGLGQFYRFSAVEVSPDRLKTRAVTYVLSGGILAAFLGPTSAQVTANVIGKQYMGSFLTIGLVGVINQVVITLVNFPPVKKAEVKTETIAVIDYQRSVREIVFQQKFVIACAVATLAHSIMIMLMSNVTLSMKGNDYSLAICSLVMELHFFSMFAPGFFTGRAIERYGTMIVAFTGGLIFAGSAIVLAVGIELWNYILGMSLLGIAWNLSFSAGTVMLTTTYKVQVFFSIKDILK